MDAPIEEQPEAPKDKTSKPLSDNFIEAITDNPKKTSREVLIDNVIENSVDNIIDKSNDNSPLKLQLRNNLIVKGKNSKLSSDDLIDAVTDNPRQALKEEYSNLHTDNASENSNDNTNGNSIGNVIDDRINNVIDNRIDNVINNSNDNSIDNVSDARIDSVIDDRIDNVIDNSNDNSIANVIDARIDNVIDDRIDNAIDNSNDNHRDKSIGNSIDNSIENSIEDSIDNVNDNSIDNIIGNSVETVIDNQNDANNNITKDSIKCPPDNTSSDTSDKFDAPIITSFDASKESFNCNVTENHNRNSIDKVEYHILSNDHTNDTLIKNSERALDDKPISNHKNHSTILINASINDISKTFSKDDISQNQSIHEISKDPIENLTDVQTKNYSDTPIKDCIDSVKSFVVDDTVEATKDVDIRFINENGVNKPQPENNHFFMDIQMKGPPNTPYHPYDVASYSIRTSIDISRKSSNEIPKENIKESKSSIDISSINVNSSQSNQVSPTNNSIISSNSKLIDSSNKTNAENVIDVSSIKAIHDDSTTNLDAACIDNHKENLKEVPVVQAEECYGKDSSKSPAIVPNDSFNDIATNILINDSIEENCVSLASAPMNTPIKERNYNLIDGDKDKCKDQDVEEKKKVRKKKKKKEVKKDKEKAKEMKKKTPTENKKEQLEENKKKEKKKIKCKKLKRGAPRNTPDDVCYDASIESSINENVDVILQSPIHNSNHSVINHNCKKINDTNQKDASSQNPSVDNINKVDLCDCEVFTQVGIPINELKTTPKVSFMKKTANSLMYSLCPLLHWHFCDSTNVL